jgi:hypothetical protein
MNTYEHPFIEPKEETDKLFLDKRKFLDGGGSHLKYIFLEQTTKLNKYFNCGFEWCSGLGEIGLKLLEKGIIKELVLADINKDAIEASIEITKKLGLEKKVRHYISDGLKDIPKSERFDIVFANPPNYFNLQKEHFWGNQLYFDLRPNDREWKIHLDFYNNINKFLNKDAILLIQEVEIFKKFVYIGDKIIPYDIRPEEPIISFIKMISRNNLKVLDIIKNKFDTEIDLHFLLLSN